MHTQVFIAVGANLPSATGMPPSATCRWAVGAAAAASGLTLTACSRWYRSAPVPPSGQPDYVNGVAQLEGQIDPFRFLGLLHAIEAEAGRRRSVPNAARPLDLDLIAVGGLVIDDPALQLPHPRMAQRAFVLAPLCELAPDWMHPVLRRTASSLLADCDMAGLSLLSLADDAGST